MSEKVIVELLPRTGEIKKAFRTDVQGLRAIAVVVVIFDHLLSWPSGGFVGVDVFFVISGFLITGLLMREYEQTGHVSFIGFYRRRLKRILPAASLVLVVTVGGALLVFNAGRAVQVVWDAFWATVFSANWHFALIGTDYFQAGGPTSPLQHYWSLAVEEQFYFVWPWLMLAGFVITRRCTRSAKSVKSPVAITLALIIAASFVWSLWESRNDASFAYFSTLSRTWELGFGSLLAVSSTTLGRLPSRFRPFLAWGGLGGIALSLFVINDDVPFPAPWAALPVLGTAAVIAAGTGRQAEYLAPLRSRPVVYIGEISYSLYLWHFPVIIVLGSVLTAQSVMRNLAILALVACLAVASHHLFEDPIRRSSWLERISHYERRRRRLVRRRQIRALLHGAFPAYAVLVVAALWTTGFAVSSIPDAHSPLSAQSIDGDPITIDGDPIRGSQKTGQELSGRAAEIENALGARSFPKLSPTIAELGTENWVKEVNAGGCAEINPKNVSRCAWGPANASVQVAVLGDSIGIAWMPGLKEAATALGWRIHPFTMGQCPAPQVAVAWTGGAHYAACDAHREWALQAISALHPDITILASAAVTLRRLTDRSSDAAAVEEVRKGTEATIDALKGSTAAVIVLAAPPDGQSLLECATKFATPVSCEAPIPRIWRSMQQSEQDAAAAKGARYVDTFAWFCSASGRCPAFIGRTPVRTDGNHMTTAYSRGLASELEAMLKKNTPTP